jgi:RHS repeat-associated protein
MIAKLNTDGTFHSRKWSCVWRPDIGSSLYARSDWMRAGGVGGVAWMQTGAVQSYSYGTGGAEVHVPLADHMGNVRRYYQFRASGKTVTGQLVASYEYDAFGREVRAWGLNTPTENQPPGLPSSRPWADLLPFHYSSKLRDVDSGFNYYGYRFYDPGAGRWLNRDPIGEQGGLNLYGMVGNDGVNLIDYLGLDWIQYTGTQITMYGGAPPDKSKVIAQCNATSGLTSESQKPSKSNVPNEGPIPGGDYSINLKGDPNRVAPVPGPTPGGGISQLPRKPDGTTAYPDWGDQRAKLDPKKGTKTHGRDSFYIHDSAKGYTHGCIEVPCKDLFEKLKEYRKAGAKSIDVNVDYSNSNSTNGGTRDSRLPPLPVPPPPPPDTSGAFDGIDFGN